EFSAQLDGTVGALASLYAAPQSASVLSSAFHSSYNLRASTTVPTPHFVSSSPVLTALRPASLIELRASDSRPRRSCSLSYHAWTVAADCAKPSLASSTDIARRLSILMMFFSS